MSFLPTKKKKSPPYKYKGADANHSEFEQWEERHAVAAKGGLGSRRRSGGEF